MHFNITQWHPTSLQSLAFYHDPIRLYIKKLKILNYFATFLRHLEKQVNFQFLVMKRYLKYMYVYWGFSCWIFNKRYVKYIYLIVCRCFYCHFWFIKFVNLCLKKFDTKCTKKMRTTVWNKFITFNLKCFKYMYGHFNFICWCFLSFEINLYPVSDLTAFLSIVYYAVNDITVLSNIWLNINEINQYNNPIYKTVGLSSLSQRSYYYQYVVFLFYRCQMA